MNYEIENLLSILESQNDFNACLVHIPPIFEMTETHWTQVLASLMRFVHFPLNNSTNASITNWLSITADINGDILLRSFILNITRQDWTSNSPYMRNKRITPGVVFLSGYIARYAAILHSEGDSNVLLSYFFSKVLRKIVTQIFYCYLELQPSRVRIHQWRMDLAYFASYLEYGLDILCKISTSDRSLQDFPENVVSVIVSYRTLCSSLALLQEQNFAAIRQRSEGMLKRRDILANKTLKNISTNTFLICPSISLRSSYRTILLFGFSLTSDYPNMNEHGEIVSNEINYYTKIREDFQAKVVERDFRSCDSSMDYPDKNLVVLTVLKRNELIQSVYPPLDSEQERLREELQNYVNYLTGKHDTEGTLIT